MYSIFFFNRRCVYLLINFIHEPDRGLCLSCARLQLHPQSLPSFVWLLFHLSHFPPSQFLQLLCCHVSFESLFVFSFRFVARSVQIWAQYFNIGLIKTRLMISDRDQQIKMLFLTQQFRMLFLTQHVELASHGCVRQEMATCQTEFALLPECAGNTRSRVLEQETVLLRVRDETRDRTCQNRVALLRVRSRTRDRTCQSRVELLRVRGETRDRTCQNTTRTDPGVRG